MSTTPKSVNEAKNEAREYIKLTQTNSVQLAGTVIEKIKIEGQVKTKDKVVLVDNEGNPLRYPDRFKVKVSFVGGEIIPEIKADQYNGIVEGEMYLFGGRLGLVREFGNESISYVFNTVELI